MSDRPLPHSNPPRGFVCALASIILLATGFITGKYALREFNPETLSLVWTTAGAAYALLFLLWRGFGRELLIPRRLVAPILVLGLITGSAMILTWASLRLLDPTFAGFFWRFLPVVSIILSFLLLGERLSAWELPPVAVMLFGAMTCTYGQWTIVGRGVILISVAVLFAAAQALIAKVVVPDIHPRVLVFYRNGMAAVGIAAWIVPAGRFDLSLVHLDTWIVVLGGGHPGAMGRRDAVLRITALLGAFAIQSCANHPTALCSADGRRLFTSNPETARVGRGLLYPGGRVLVDHTTCEPNPFRNAIKNSRG